MLKKAELGYISSYSHVSETTIIILKKCEGKEERGRMPSWGLQRIVNKQNSLLLLQ